jgi:hypothetical protein
MSGDIEEEAPPEVRHYSNRGEVPWDIQKYLHNSSLSEILY